MKTKEELNALKNEVEVLNQKLSTLTEEELAQVTGGAAGSVQFFNEDKGFGFIKPEDGGRDIFAQPIDIKVHENARRVLAFCNIKKQQKRR